MTLEILFLHIVSLALAITSLVLAPIILFERIASHLLAATSRFVARVFRFARLVVTAAHTLTTEVLAGIPRVTPRIFISMAILPGHAEPTSKRKGEGKGKGRDMREEGSEREKKGGLVDETTQTPRKRIELERTEKGHLRELGSTLRSELEVADREGWHRLRRVARGMLVMLENEQREMEAEPPIRQKP